VVSEELQITCECVSYLYVDASVEHNGHITRSCMLTGKQPDEYIGDVRTQAKKERCNVVVSSLYLGCVIMMAPQPLTFFFEKNRVMHSK
jgi:hypothetical protein